MGAGAKIQAVVLLYVNYHRLKPMASYFVPLACASESIGSSRSSCGV
ncbi:hypothetical protein [Methanolobus sp.]|nr:hypothetical protein [Methanolobus sp.]